MHIEQVQRVNYDLGAVIERNGVNKTDILTRISKAQQVFNQVGVIWRKNVVRKTETSETIQLKA
jgi:hypothetical protein